VQYRPSAEELLSAIAELLEGELLPALPEALKHKCRVAANLARILEREQRLGAEAAAGEHDRLASLLGSEGDPVALSAELAERIRTDDDPAFQRSAWDTLVAITRGDLSIAKPGHDAWEGR
jgi:hypothetical protein